jgi:hypothetical protein
LLAQRALPFPTVYNGKVDRTALIAPRHGFGKAENIRQAIDGEFYFYSRVFGFKPAEELPVVAIANLD